MAFIFYEVRLELIQSDLPIAPSIKPFLRLNEDIY